MKEIIRTHCTKNLNCDNSLLNKKINETSNCVEKEKIHIFETYYAFTNNHNCVDFVIQSFNYILEDVKSVEKDDLITIIIIILKGFLDKNFNKEINEHFLNSDDLLNHTVLQYRSYLMLSKKFMTDKRINTTCLLIIDLLVQKNQILEKKINIKSAFNFKTIKFYYIKDMGYIKNLSESLLFSYKDFELIEFNDNYYITTGHFSKTFELYKKNFNSNKRFKLKKINYILSKINVKLYVDNSYQYKLKELLNINKPDLINTIKLNTKEINLLFATDNWTYLTKEKISFLQSENSKLLDLLLHDYFADLNFQLDFIYFPIFLDFRGRKYYYSKIGPTSSKLIRLAFFYGWYDQKIFNESNNYFSKNYYKELHLFCNKYNINNNEKYFEIYFWCLISIGKFFINKNLYPIAPSAFIDLAVLNFDNLSLLSIENKLEIIHYKNIISSVIEEKPKKRTIIKDATASINQIFMKKLGPLDQTSMNYVNLGENNAWYDTYSVCKDLFYDYIKEDPFFKYNWNKNDFDRILCRNLIKNPVMIIPYSAGNALCWENYKKKIITENYAITIDKNLKKIITMFFNFIRKDMQELFLYNKTSTALINQISEEFEELRKYVLESETGIADISYYKMKKSSIDKKYKLNGENKRITKLILTPTNALDKETFDIAAGANMAHFLDGDEIRSIETELGYSVITIHDSYLIDFNNCSKLIITKINHYQKEIDKITSGYKINNMFILL